MLFAYFVYYFANVTKCCSIFMTMALTFERFLAMKLNSPPSVIPRNYSNCLQWVKMLLLCVCPVVIFSMLFNIPKMFEVEVGVDDGEYYNETVYFLKATDLRLDYNYVLCYNLIGQMVVTGVIPLITLTVLNCFILRKI